MQDKAYIRALIAYNTWANAETYRIVGQLPPEEISRQRPSFLKSIHNVLNHLLVVDHIWLAHMQGRPHGFEALQAPLHEDFAGLAAARVEMDATLEAYVEGLSPEDFEDVIDYELIGGNTGRMSRAMILTHLALHGSYHRGWVADMMGQIPETQPFMDLPIYERVLQEGGHPPLP